MKSYDEWKAEIDFAIENIKSVGRKVYYGLSLQMTDETAGTLKKEYEAYRDWETDRKSTRLNSSHSGESRMPSSA